MRFIKLYFLSFAIFAAIDFIWLAFVAKKIYQEQIGFLLASEFRLLPALLFYIIYIFGLVFFAVLPTFGGGRLDRALLFGALFGLVCYATYDLTNLATLKGWPVKIVVIDLVWGSFISALTSGLCYAIGNQWNKYFH